MALRFLIQLGIVVIPKSVHPTRMAQNLGIWDFELSSADMITIQALDEERTVFDDHRDPKFVERINGLKF